jgi:hypothetical protein
MTSPSPGQWPRREAAKHSAPARREAASYSAPATRWHGASLIGPA